MVENPSDKFILMYLLLGIIMLLAGVHLAFKIVGNVMPQK